METEGTKIQVHPWRQHSEFEANRATEDSVSITATSFRDKDNISACLSAELVEQPFPYEARVL